MIILENNIPVALIAILIYFAHNFDLKLLQTTDFVIKWIILADIQLTSFRLGFKIVLNLPIGFLGFVMVIFSSDNLTRN